MRLIIAISFVFLAGCATSSAFSGYCTVYELLGGTAEPMGLVTLPPEQESFLRSQLPAGVKDKYICWYASDDRLIAGGRRDLNTTNAGYIFIKRDGTWILADAEPIILHLPRAF